MANQVLYGFQSLKQLFGERVNEVGVDIVATAIQQSVAEHNRQMDALMSLFVTRTTQYKVRYKTPVATRLQAMDENGRARPIASAGYYDVAFPLQEGAAAWGANYKARAKMTVQEANDVTSTLISADVRWIRDHILAALFANSSWTFNDPAKGDLTILGLANGDSVIYQLMTGADAGATDNHYLAQANAIDNSNDPFQTIRDELMEHPENAGSEVVAFVPTGLKSAIRALSGFVPVSDPKLQYGSTVTQLVANPGISVPGEIFGYHDDGVWLCEWRSMPANYILGVATEGPRPLAMREEPESELQGFRQVATREDHPFWESQWVRNAGFGAWNRVGALVYRVGNGSYAVPTGYVSPMA